MFKKSKAFTLVELVVVMVIIGLLFVFLIPKIDFATTKARESGLKTDFHSFEIAFESVCNEESGIGGTQFANKAAAATAFNDYLDAALQITGDASAKNDPWNHAYKFEYSGLAASNNGIAVIYSAGKAGTGTVTVTDPTATAAGTATSANGAYIIATTYQNGVTKTTTSGFSKNIQ